MAAGEKWLAWQAEKTAYASTSSPVLLDWNAALGSSNLSCWKGALLLCCAALGACGRACAGSGSLSASCGCAAAAKLQAAVACQSCSTPAALISGQGLEHSCPRWARPAAAA